VKNFTYLSALKDIAVTIKNEAGQALIHLSHQNGNCVEILASELDDLIHYVKQELAPQDATEATVNTPEAATVVQQLEDMVQKAEAIIHPEATA